MGGGETEKERGEEEGKGGEEEKEKAQVKSGEVKKAEALASKLSRRKRGGRKNEDMFDDFFDDCGIDGLETNSVEEVFFFFLWSHIFVFLLLSKDNINSSFIFLIFFLPLFSLRPENPNTTREEKKPLRKGTKKKKKRKKLKEPPSGG